MTLAAVFAAHIFLLQLHADVPPAAGAPGTTGRCGRCGGGAGVVALAPPVTECAVRVAVVAVFRRHVDVTFCTAVNFVVVGDTAAAALTHDSVDGDALN